MGGAVAAMSGPVLHVEIARKAFGARVVLADLRFDLAPGEILAIGGPSGCGKSTLLRLVAGLDRDYAGRIVAPPRIAMAFQEPRLLPWRSARDNLVLAGADPGTAGTLLGELGLADAADVPADRLSLGMARRVALARALAVPADLLLLDEPFASLDEAAAARARMLLLSAWRARPCAAVMVTHDLGEATALADRIMLLEGDPARVGREILVPAESRRPAARYFKVSR
jgi:NitT/TauT family transport system ATP-binding protein